VTGKIDRTFTLDTIMPSDMAARAEESGIRRAAMDPLTVLVLGIMAGAFISFGAIFATTVSAGTSGWPYGAGRLLSGVVFSVGLILVVVLGAVAAERIGRRRKLA